MWSVDPRLVELVLDWYAPPAAAPELEPGPGHRSQLPTPPHPVPDRKLAQGPRLTGSVSNYRHIARRNSQYSMNWHFCEDVSSVETGPRHTTHTAHTAHYVGRVVATQSQYTEVQLVARRVEHGSHVESNRDAIDMILLIAPLPRVLASGPHRVDTSARAGESDHGPAHAACVCVTEPHSIMWLVALPCWKRPPNTASHISAERRCRRA